jgi:hypothetical protein
MKCRDLALVALTAGLMLVACRKSPPASKANRVSFVVKGATLEDVLRNLSLMSGMTVSTRGVEADRILVTGEVDDVPWDCPVLELASKLRLALEADGSKNVTLVRK